MIQRMVSLGAGSMIIFVRVHNSRNVYSAFGVTTAVSANRSGAAVYLLE